jgi:excisionase family DNA binding protein
VPHYNAIIELDQGASDQAAEHLIDTLAGHGYSPAASTSAYGRLELVLTVPADTLRQAAATSLAIAESAAGVAAITLQVLPTEEFDRRNGLEPVPELVSVAEAAQVMGVSRQRVLQMVDEGKLPHHRIGEKRTVVIARAAVERVAAERTGTVYQCVDCGKPTRPGSVRCDEDSLAAAGSEAQPEAAGPNNP